MTLLFMERFVTPIALTLCCTESGNVDSTQPTMIISIEDEMELEKEAKDFMDKRSREPKTLFEVLKEINRKLEKFEDALRDIKETVRKIDWKG